MIEALHQRAVTLNGKRFQYIEAGAGTPILLLGGMPVSCDNWRPIVKDLSQTGRCIAFDFISEQGIAPLEEQAHLLHLLVDTLHLDDMTLVMHGTSTLAGLSWVKAFGKVCKALAFIDPWLGNVSSEKPLLWCEQLQSITKAPLNADALSAILYQLAPNADLSESIAKYQGQFETLAANYQSLAATDFGPAGKQITALCEYLQTDLRPKLLVYGMPGFMLPLEQAIWAKQSWQNLQLREIEDTFHMIAPYKVDELASVLTNWSYSFTRTAEAVE